MPTAIQAYLCTTAPPNEGFFQVKPKYKERILRPKNKRQYFLFSSLIVDAFKLSPTKTRNVPEPKNNIPYLIVLFINDCFNRFEVVS